MSFVEFNKDRAGNSKVKPQGCRCYVPGEHRVGPDCFRLETNINAPKREG